MRIVLYLTALFLMAIGPALAQDRVTIIPDDRIVIIDGESYKVDLALDDNIHALQWYGDYGIVEKKQGGSEYIESLAPFEGALAAWRAARKSRNDALRQAEQERQRALREYEPSDDQIVIEAMTAKLTAEEKAAARAAIKERVRNNVQ